MSDPVDQFAWNHPDLRVASDSVRAARYRLLQSFFREHVLQARHGWYHDRRDLRPVGSLLHPDEVSANPGLNFLSGSAGEYARARVETVQREGGSAERNRLLHNMLSSMPMCFSIFGHLRSQQDKGLTLVQELLDPEATSVALTECEWKPPENRLGDRTAFDAVVVTVREDGSRHLTGIETKYTEPFSQEPYEKPSYTHIHEDSSWFHAGTSRALVAAATNQLWRNTLLAAACELSEVEGVSSASVVVLSLAEDPGAKVALDGVRRALKAPDEHCRHVPLESLVGIGKGIPSLRAWAESFERRYLDLTPVA